MKINIERDIPLTAWRQVTGNVLYRRTLIDYRQTPADRSSLFVALVTGQDGGRRVHVHATNGPDVASGVIPAHVRLSMAQVAATRLLRRVVRERRGF